MSFTPGKWEIESARKRIGRFMGGGHYGYNVVTFTDKQNRKGKNIKFTIAAFVRKADAPLIAAAPEMLKLLKGTLRHIRKSSIEIRRSIKTLLNQIEGDEYDGRQ